MKRRMGKEMKGQRNDKKGKKEKNKARDWEIEGS